MRRVYRLLISTLVIIGIVAVAPAETPVDKTEQAICAVKAGCDTDQIASADVKKKKKKKKKKGEKAEKERRRKKVSFPKSLEQNNFFHDSKKGMIFIPFFFAPFHAIIDI